MYSQPGCVILLIDDSSAMKSELAEASPFGANVAQKSKADSVASAVNATLRQLAEVSDFEVALVNYQSAAQGQSVVGSVWGGALAGRGFVSLSEIRDNPACIEQRLRKVPDPNSILGYREEAVEVPVWYTPNPQGNAPLVQALQHCRELLVKWMTATGTNHARPLVIHVFGGSSSDGSTAAIIDAIQKLGPESGRPIVMQAHLGVAKGVPATAYSTNRVFLPAGPARDLFDRSSVLTPEMVAGLRDVKVNVGKDARAAIYNAKMLDVLHLLSLIKTHTKSWPSRSAGTTPVSTPVVPAPTSDAAVATVSENSLLPEAASAETPRESARPPAAEVASPGGEKAALVVLVLDRSVEDPSQANDRNSCARLQEYANEVLGKISKRAGGDIDVSMISYGNDPFGGTEIRSTFEGALAGRAIVRDSELADGALRIDEGETEVPNGIGGVIVIPFKKPIFVEVEPTSATTPQGAFETARQAVAEWSTQHPSPRVAPVVVHLTRGRSSGTELQAAIESVRSAAPGGAVVYHLIVTETPHTSVVYPSTGDVLQTDELRSCWEATSLLLGRERLSATRKTVTIESRGIVVNAQFDLLLDEITNALSS